MDYKEAAETLEREAQALGLHLECKQIPLSQSRHAQEKSLSVEWECKLRKGFATLDGATDRVVHTFSYSQGIGHLRGYQYTDAKWVGYWKSVEGDARLRNVCEGRIDKGPSGGIGPGPLSAIAPTLADALGALLLDGSAIDRGSFEEWADEYGYDRDSRKAEASYRACLETGLKLRKVLGDETFRRFRELTSEM